MNRWLLACALVVGFVGCAAQEDVPLTNDQVGEHAPRSLQRARFLERQALTDLASYKRAATAYRRSELLESAIGYYLEARDVLKDELAMSPGPRLRREYLDQELLRLEGVLDLLVRRRELTVN
ncbi:MAG: hypothetical protein KDD82_03090 [Planctomycetes bacterium]|nr:hypothetical protein [Planctomycetota bacterium]